MNSSEHTGFKDCNGIEIKVNDIVTSDNLDYYIITFNKELNQYVLFKDSFYLSDAVKEFNLRVVGSVKYDYSKPS